MRARYPDTDGYVERDGVKLFVEVFGEGEPTVLLLPTWSIMHSRHWKAQIPYLARHFRVVSFDGRGSGRSDRPSGVEAHRDSEYAADALAVCDHLEVERAVLVGLSRGGYSALVLADLAPHRVAGIIALAPGVSFEESNDDGSFIDPIDDTEGWAKWNQHYWRASYRDFLEFFFAEACPEPHSTKQIEDCVGWGLETTPEILIDTILVKMGRRPSDTLAMAGRVRCPVLVIHGSDDRIVSHSVGARYAELTGGALVTLDGAGHMLNGRHPVVVNRLIRRFAEQMSPKEVPR